MTSWFSGLTLLGAGNATFVTLLAALQELWKLNFDPNFLSFMNLHLLNECVLTHALLEEKGCPRDSVAVFPLSDISISSINHQPVPETLMFIPNTESLDLKFRLILLAYNSPGEEETLCFLSK